MPGWDGTVALHMDMGAVGHGWKSMVHDTSLLLWWILDRSRVIVSLMLIFEHNLFLLMPDSLKTEAC